MANFNYADEYSRIVDYAISLARSSSSGYPCWVTLPNPEMTGVSSEQSILSGIVPNVRVYVGPHAPEVSKKGTLWLCTLWQASRYRVFSVCVSDGERTVWYPIPSVYLIFRYTTLLDMYFENVISTVVGNGGGSGTGTGDLQLELYSENPSYPTPPVATGQNSVAIGNMAHAAVDSSYAVGEQSLSRLEHSMMFAGGRFASSGDAQAGRYLMRTVTTSNIEMEALLDGVNGSKRLVLPDDSVWTFTAHVTARDGSTGKAGFKFEGVVYRDAGASSIAFLGKPTSSILARSDQSWSARICAEPSKGSLSFKFTGAVGKTIRWLVHVETLEVTQ